MSIERDGYHIITGAIHMHTTESDGSLPLEEVVTIGQEAGLDFLVFTDHMTISNRENGKEKMYGKLLVVVGYEHNDQLDHHHYLLLDSPKVYDARLSAKEYVAAGAKDNAIGILAHPDEIRNKLKQFPPYPWDDWTVEGFTGIELWNQMSEWMEKLTWWNKLPMALWPKRTWIGPTDRILKKWDELSQARKVLGMFGVDAHSFPRNLGPIKFRLFSYKLHFQSLRNHIILDSPLAKGYATAKKQFLDALRDCRVFCSNHLLGDASSFAFSAISGADKVTCGGSIADSKQVRLQIALPKAADLRILHNGAVIYRNSVTSIELPVKEPGLYRVEAWQGERMWILSNHIRIGV